MVTNTTAATETELVETGEKHDTLGRRHTPAERRAELLAAYRASGLTQSAFARREGVRYSTFCTWAQATNGLEVRLPDGTLLRGGSAVELAALVRAVRA